MKVQAALTVIRDILFMALGTFIIVHEELTGHVHLELIGAGMTALGLPVGVAIHKLSRGKPTIPDTQSESSSSVSSSSQP